MKKQKQEKPSLEKYAGRYELYGVSHLSPPKGRVKCKKRVEKSTLFFGRDEATRTPDPYVPNVVRYQLRYIPIASKSGCKGKK